MYSKSTVGIARSSAFVGHRVRYSRALLENIGVQGGSESNLSPPHELGIDTPLVQSKKPKKSASPGNRFQTEINRIAVSVVYEK